jgi:hypothetical protein
VSGGDVASTTDGGIFRITANPVSVSISGITLAHGNTSVRGGALAYISVPGASGNLTLNGVTIENNHAQYYGGGVYQRFGTLIVANSTISGNSSNGGGGGLGSNYAGLTLTNSTISGNSSAAVGGGFYSRAAFQVSNSTISGNTAFLGGGFWSRQSDGTLANSIVANNTANSGAEFYANHGNGPPVTITANNNLIKGIYDVNGMLSGTGNIFGQDPQLGALAYNGGPTRTFALLPGSPAIDAGDNGTCAATDQRGVARPIDGELNGSAICDIGSFELIPDRIFADGFD